MQTLERDSVEDEIQDIKQYIEESLGSLPLVLKDEWEAESFNWQDALIFFTKSGFKNTGIFEVRLEPTIPLSNKPVFHIEYQPSALHIILGNYSFSVDESNNKLREILKKLIETFAIHITNEDNFFMQIDQIVKFMHVYATLPTFSRPLSMYSIEKLQVYIPEFNWRKMFQRIVNRHLEIETEVAVEGIEWLKSVINAVHNTTKRTIANYLVLNTIASLYVNQELSLSLQSRIRDDILNVTEIITPYEPQIQKSDFCVRHSGQISNAVKVVHFNKYLSHEMRVSVKLLVKQIHEAFFNLFQDSSPNENLLTNIERIFENNNTDIPLEIAVDENYFDTLYLDNEYEKLPSDRSSFILNVLAIKKFKVDEWIIGQKSTGFQQPDVTYIGNLETGLQKIVVAGSLLSGIVFEVNRTAGFNFGTLGFKICEGLIRYLQPFTDLNQHHLLHSADPISDTPDYMLKLYSNEVKELPEFKKWPKWKEQDLYKTVLFQNIAVKLSYSAYKYWLVKHNEDSQLPGLDLNSTQLFWLGFTTLQCSAYEEMYTKSLPFYTPNENKISVLTLFHLIQDFKLAFHC